LITSFFGGGPLGTVTAGSFDSGEGGAGVVTDAVVVDGVGAAAVTAASVRPADGASAIPFEFEEPPHAASPTPSATVAGAISNRLGDIERDRVADEFENAL
jgi:hypothetical protein